MGIAEADLKVGDRVVYPNQGVCRVVGTTEMEIAGQREVFIKLAREDDEGTVMVPKGRLEKVGIRRVADSGELKKIFTYLAAPIEGPELDWKVRHRTHGERMSEGGLMGLAQVVKGLTTLADLRPLPPKERELYDNARHLLVAEVAAAAGITEVSAEDAVDLALFPPGVERKKLDLAAVQAMGGGDDLGEDLGDALDLGEGLALPGEPEEEPEEAEEEAGEEAEAEEEEEAPKKKPAAKKAAKAAEPKPKKEKKEKAPAKPKAEKPKKAAAKPKAEKEEKPKKAAAKPKAKPKK